MDKQKVIHKTSFKLHKKEILIPFILFLLAFSIRFIYLNQIKTGPLFTPTEATVDEYLYDSWAKEIAFKDPVGKEAFWGLPLYPYFLGFIYFFFGPNVFIARLIQLIVGSISCVLLYFIGKKIFNKPVGIIAGLTLSLYNASIFYEGFLVSTAISIFLTCVLILFILSFDQKPNYKKSVLLGIIFGLTALATPSIFLFLLFFIFWAFRNFKYVIVMILLCIAIIAPITIRNYIIEKDFIPITSHNGINFYAGNNPASLGTFSLPYYLGTDANTIKQNSRTMAEKYTKMKLKPSQASQFWLNMGLTFIKQNPLLYTKLLFKKFLLFWNHYEISDLCNIDFFKQFAGILKLPLVNYAFISIFALIGIFLSFISRKKWYILLQLLILSNLISLMLYFVNTRYRLPSIPSMILFSSYGIYSIYRSVLEKKFRLLLYFFMGTLGLYLIVNLNLIKPSPENSYNNLGNLYVTRGEYQLAIKEFNKAIELNPNYPAVHNNLGMVYMKLGKFSEAIKEYKLAINLFPDYTTAHNNLGIIYKKLGRLNEAINEYGIAIKINPGALDSYYNLGLLYLEKGNYAEAIENFKKVLEIEPKLAEAHNKIAICYKEIGHAK